MPKSAGHRKYTGPKMYTPQGQRTVMVLDRTIATEQYARRAVYLTQLCGEEYARTICLPTEKVRV